MSIFSMNHQNYPVLEGTKETEVCIIGGGIAGLNLAFLLKQSGKKVIVVEAETIGHAQSSRSTAKITCLPGFLYHDLMEQSGLNEAMKAARCMRSALQKYADILYHHQINCQFERLPFLLFSKDFQRIKKEAEAMKKLNFHVKTEHQKTVFGEGEVLILENQAQFHPGLWMEHISKGLEIYEHSRVIHVEDHDVFTAKGRVRANKIVFCDHYPFVNFPGMHFMKMSQERSHVLALSNVKREEMMLYCADEPIESLRFSNHTALYSGFSHPAGKGEADVIEQMKRKAKERFPQCEIESCWSAQDCMTLDGLPYIGLFSGTKQNWYVSTGFNKWGMIYSMVSAMILHDKICGTENIDASVFDSLRSILNHPANELKLTCNAASGWMKEWFTVPNLQMSEIPKNEGALIELDGMSLGCYHDEDDTYYLVSTRCPHLKCQLTWNGAEKSWDCPCHGSRYDRYGNRIEGPAESQTILIRKEKQ